MVENPKSHLGFSSFLLFFFAIASLSLCKPALSVPERGPDPSPPTVYEILAQYGLPSGLLPDSVTGYTLSDDGRFVVELAKPCYVQFDYLVYYEKKITGELGYGYIKDLEGIQVQRFFFWLNVNEIKTDLPPSDSIYFQVGIINKKLRADQFKTVHSCRKGVSGSCQNSWKRFVELPAGKNEIEVLLTE